MAKRKRVEIVAPAEKPAPGAASAGTAKKAKSGSNYKTTASASTPTPQKETTAGNATEGFSLQIITGSYDRVLHGIVATISAEGQVDFADSFLFNAHPSQIRCIAVSPPSAPAPGQDQKVLLASGSTDPKINIYSLSAHPPKRRRHDEISKVAVRPILENSQNRELGLYNPHDSTVTKLAFPTRSKLISSSEDSTIAVAKTRNWEQMSTIKAPKPKPMGRPSGDTAALGDTPAGINDFAVHPSLKLLLTVSRGERCMRLWNLLTGKKAAVLNFSKDMLIEAGEGRHSTGEGRKVVWGPGADSEEFAVGFDRNIVVFGMDSMPRCRVMPDNKTKIHQFAYVDTDDDDAPVIAVSTEDGSIVFFSTADEDLTSPEAGAGKLKQAKRVAQIGGKEAGITGRVKDFTVIKRQEGGSKFLYIISGSSDGKVRLWKIGVDALKARGEAKEDSEQAGKLLGTYGTDNRITCTTAFEMIPRTGGSPDDEESELEGDAETEEEGDSEDEA